MPAPQPELQRQSVDLISEIGRDLMRAGDALFEARIKFGELRKLLRGVTHGDAGPQAEAHATPAEPRATAQPASSAKPAVRASREPAYTLNGQAMSVAQLAALAGCKAAAMQWRLKSMGLSPEEAVAAGARMPNRNQGTPPPEVAEPGRHGPPPTHMLDGKPIYVRELARMAGCSKAAMQQRLSKHGMTPEQAVAAGARMTTGGASPKQKQARRVGGAHDAGVAPPAPPTRAKSVFDVSTGAAVIAKVRATQHSVRAFAPDAEVIIPPDVKRTVAETPKDRRFEIDGPRPSTFGRIGQYESTGSAIERQYRSGGGGA